MEPKTVRRAAGVRPARHLAPENPGNALVAGTVVLTLDGALPVEFLTEGDRVITRDSGMAVVKSIRRQRRRTCCVAIKAGSLGNTRPDREAVFAAAQEVLIRDWRAEALFGASQALVPIARLIDGEFVRDLGEVDVETIELIFDTPHILYADGLEVASTSVKATQTA